MKKNVEKIFETSFAELTLNLIGDKWKLQILEKLSEGTKRFGELKKSLANITQKVLTSNLRAMEESGLLVRNVYAQIPPRVEYTLTSVGESLKPVIDTMTAWGAEYQERLSGFFANAVVNLETSMTFKEQA